MIMTEIITGMAERTEIMTEDCNKQIFLWIVATQLAKLIILGEN